VEGPPTQRDSYGEGIFSEGGTSPVLISPNQNNSLRVGSTGQGFVACCGFVALKWN
jgi:hypothetical protein